VFLALTLVSLGSAGCRNPTNVGTYGQYSRSGRIAEERGDLLMARREYSRALWNARAGWLGPKAEATALYDWSRLTGYLGGYAEAEQGFREVLQLIGKSKGEANELEAPALCELARLLFDTQQFEKAVAVFEIAVPALEKRDAPHVDPIGFAEFLDDYEAALRAVELTARADEVSQRSAAIRLQNHGATAKFRVRRYSN
jgi:tetratricopeptide (TPR) repeat protein